MEQVQQVGRYGEPLFQQGVLPKTVDISAANYPAESIDLVGDGNSKQQPFIIRHPTEIALTVIPWHDPTDTPVLMTFKVNDPIVVPLKQVNTDGATTDLQITY